MFDTYTRDLYATTLTQDQLATKLAIIENIIFNLHLDIIGNDNYENFNKKTEIALTEVCNDLYKALHNKDLF
jgi:hypothetical protein